MRATDSVMPDGRWEFDEAVTDCFDDMLARSIPQYDAMRAAVTDLASYFIRRSGGRAHLLDLGSSRGEAAAPIMRRNATARYTLTEISPPMLDVLRANYSQIADVKELDLRYEWPSTPPLDVITSVLTLLFTPIEFRQHIIQSAYDSLKPGGALIVVEKLLPEGARIDDVQTGLYWQMKSENGYSAEAIVAKAKSLQGVQVCLSDSWNRDLLFQAGFAEVDCFWRWMSFAGYVAVK